MNSPVEILLSTFNGEKYLAAQLDSLFQQDYPHWKLLVRDDGSTDTTLSILNDYVNKHPEKITILNDKDGNIGYSRSFSKLLRQSSADYVMYCDQDDYWQPSKTSTMLSLLLAEELRLPGIACLVFSDLQVADSELKVISHSFLKGMRYSSGQNAQVFFLKNYVPGCNMLFNRALIKQALETDNIINLHDHWLMMVCSAVGKIICIDRPLMKYRIHDNNAIGFLERYNSPQRGFRVFIKEVLKYGFANKKYRELLYSRNIRQLQNICNHFPTTASRDAIAFSEIDKSFYLFRKIRNIMKPYLLEISLLKQITYIICF